MMINRSLSIAALLGLVLGLGAPTTRADVTDPSLQDLITSGGSLTVGDKVFSQFGYTATSGDAPLASNISVGQIPPAGTDAFGNFGIRFGLAGFDAPGNNVATDFLITYAVTAPSALLTDIHLLSNLSIAGTPAPGDVPFGHIVETIRAAGNPQIAQISNSVTATSSSLSALATFNPAGPYTTIFVTKDVQLFSTPGAIVTVSFIDQAFSQVPEPSAWLLTGLELSCGCVLVFSRRLRALAQVARNTTG
jgi:hypothetical protein